MRIVLGPSSFACMVGRTAAATVGAAHFPYPVTHKIMPVPAPISVRLDKKAFNLLSLLASAADKTADEYAVEIITAHCETAMDDEALMARMARALLSGRSEEPAENPKKKKAEPQIQPNGLPKGYSRTKDGEVMGNKELRSITLCTEEAAKALNTSAPTLIRAVREGAVVPYALLGSEKYPRWREDEMEQVAKWMRTPCTGGKKRNRRENRCPKCGCYFSKPGLRMHALACKA